MNIQPLHDRVVIRKLDAESTTKGGIVLPGSAQEKPEQGEVVAVGKGKKLDNGQVQPMDVTVGQKVVFGKYAGTEVKIDGVDLVVMREDDIMGILN